MRAVIASRRQSRTARHLVRIDDDEHTPLLSDMGHDGIVSRKQSSAFVDERKGKGVKEIVGTLEGRGMEGRCENVTSEAARTPFRRIRSNAFSQVEEQGELEKEKPRGRC